jgi:hypothetical protein
VSHRLAKRVLALEGRMLSSPEQPPRYVWVVGPLPEQAKANLSADQRVVLDVFRDWHGTSWGRERITNDPDDQGRDLESGGDLENFPWEVDEGCSSREQPCVPSGEGAPVGTETEFSNGPLEKLRHIP